MEQKSQDDFKSSWNMQEALTYGAFQERQQANQSFLRGDFCRAMKCLINMKQMLIGILNTTERESLETLESKFFQVAEASNLGAKNSFNKEVREAHFLAKKIANSVYCKYNDLLMDILQKKEILLNKKMDETRLTL